MMKRENQRNEKGIQILSKGNHITKLGKNHYRVESQTSDKSYHIRKLQDADVWECTCADFNFNLRKGKDDKRCKHILACVMLQTTVQQEKKIEKIDLPKVCPKCQSTTYRKHGFRIEKINIVNEKDSIKITCKGWMEKQTWREINDILRLNGFSWVSNGKDSCWLKLLS